MPANPKPKVLHPSLGTFDVLTLNLLSFRCVRQACREELEMKVGGIGEAPNLRTGLKDANHSIM